MLARREEGAAGAAGRALRGESAVGLRGDGGAARAVGLLVEGPLRCCGVAAASRGSRSPWAFW